MADKLNLLQFLLHRGRHLHDLGLHREASSVLRKLSRHPDLAAEDAEEVHQRLGEIRLDQGEHRQARRHLAAALAHQPDHAHYHYLMALACDADPQCDPKRALAALKKAVELDPTNALYQCELGLKALSLCQLQTGLRALRQAEQLAPDDPEVLDKVTQGLIEEGQADEARDLLRKAMFRNPRVAAFRSLWQRRQFEMLHAQQQDGNRRPELAESVKGPVLLPFKKIRRMLPAGRKILRQDGPAAAKPKRSMVPEPKRARSN